MSGEQSLSVQNPVFGKLLPFGSIHRKDSGDWRAICAMPTQRSNSSFLRIPDNCQVDNEDKKYPQWVGLVASISVRRQNTVFPRLVSEPKSGTMGRLS